MRELHGGHDYQADFRTRMRGEGVWADLIRQRVETARGMQRERFAKSNGVHTNSDMTPRLIKKHCELDAGLESSLIPAFREQAHQLVLERQVEAALAGVALAAGPAAKLVVDAAALMALGAEDVQAAELAHAVAELVNVRKREADAERRAKKVVALAIERLAGEYAAVDGIDKAKATEKLEQALKAA